MSEKLPAEDIAQELYKDLVEAITFLQGDDCPTQKRLAEGWLFSMGFSAINLQERIEYVAQATTEPTAEDQSQPDYQNEPTKDNSWAGEDEPPAELRAVREAFPNAVVTHDRTKGILVDGKSFRVCCCPSCLVYTLGGQPNSSQKCWHMLAPNAMHHLAWEAPFKGCICALCVLTSQGKALDPS